ncbi:50S ribosomal protein L25, partial [Candidatus Woesebacteria bacterium]|nr:50S ribosomal protein L25 [Candidatus Woesebacteria bacterium]
PVTEDILHVDFRKVNLRQKIEASVPLHLINTSEAVERKNGVLLTQLNEVTVNALPAHIPHEIEVDLAVLVEIGDAIRISDLAKSEEYEIMDDADRVIVSVTEHVEESIETETVTEAPEILTEAPPAEGEQPVEESKKE